MNKVRTRLVNFRVSDEEFTTLQLACKKQGARCLSEFARMVMLASPDGASKAVLQTVEVLDLRLTRLESSVAQLTEIIGQAVGAAATRNGD